MLFASTGLRAQTLNVANDVHTAATLTNTTVTMTGRSELHITGTGDPIPGCVIHLNSPEAWLFLRNIRPSGVNSTFLSRLRVNGAAGVLNTNLRIVQHELGTVVIPHAPDYAPMRIFDGTHFTGPSKSLKPYTYYNETNLGTLSAAAGSLILKRGYMATVAQQNTGMGSSKVYIAQDGDLEIGVLPAALNNNIRFIRILPWRWVSKKGWADCNNGYLMNHLWDYNWNNNRESSLDSEYVPIRQTRYWPGYETFTNKQNCTHLLGFNEPDSAVQANMTVAEAIAQWPEMMKSGLRLGSPAVTDGGTAWLYDFIDQCDALGYRVDFVAVHFYRANYTATGLRDYLQAIATRTKRPIWVTEFNNGANWTDNQGIPTAAANATRIGEFIDIMDNSAFVERYAVYNNVGDTRRMVWDDGWPLAAGDVYRNNASPVSQMQEIPDAGTPSAATYLFEGNTRDSSGNGHNGMAMGTPSHLPGKSGQAISLDGTNDFVRLPAKLGDSTDFSFTGWIQWNGGPIWQRIFDLGAGESKFISLVPNSFSNTLRFILKTGGAEQRVETTGLTPGQWTHVAVTLTGDTGKLFVNGALAATNPAMTINPVDVATTTNYLGKSQFAADPLFSGKMDDVRFHATALTDAQVLAAYQNTAPAFSADPLVKGAAVKLMTYSGSLAGDATDTNPGSVLKFAKIGGPTWLAIAADGRFSGIPSLNDVGPNSFLVSVTDPVGAIATTNLTIEVTHPPGAGQRYAFDGNTNASAGTSHGTAIGGPLYATGKYGQAVDLDGTNDYVTLPADVASSDDLTISTWVNWDGGAGWQRIFDFGNGTADYLFLSPMSAGTPRTVFGIRNGGAEQILDGPPLATGVWNHVAVTLSGNTGKLFINGSPVDTGTISINPGDIRPAINFIGKSQFPDPLFNGRIDEFQIHHSALADSQIPLLMNSRAPQFTADPIVKSGAVAGQPYYQSLIGSATDADAGDALTYSKVSGPAWLHVAANGSLSGTPDAGNTGGNRFIVRVTDSRMAADDAALTIYVTAAGGPTASYELNGGSLDSSGTLHGSATGAPAYVSGLHDMAASLDGADDFITLPATVASHAAITLSARVRWNGGGIWQRVFDFGNSTTQNLFLTPNSAAGTLRFAIVNGGAEQILETTRIPTGEWVHLTVTLGANTGCLYVNGALADTRPITLSPAAFNPTKNYLGKSQWPDPLFSGAIDDFRIHNRVLTGSEVAALAFPNFGIAGSGIVPATIPYASWVFQQGFALNQNGPADDPDGDGIANLLEYLFDSNPLAANSGLLPEGEIRTGGEIGLSGSAGKHYLSFQARVRKDRVGVTLVPQAAATIEGLSLPAASANAVQAGPPVSNGSFDILTFYQTTAIEDSPEGKGFMRLTVINP